MPVLRSSTPNHTTDYDLEFTPGVARYSNEIDFDEASREWMRNKKRVGLMYSYVCGETSSTGRPCQRRPKNGCAFCATHEIK